ncbi:MAG: SLC13 family permease [Planctomycetales bacterium]|nr:SLC13 family permease [Planctomycetales bacterium]
MSFELVVTLLVLGGLVLALLQERISAEIVMLTALLLLLGLGVIDAKTAFKGFSNGSVLMIAAMFVVGAGLSTTGAIEVLSRWLFGRPKPGTSLIRLIAPVAGLSAFMNNTTLVAFFLPVFVRLAKRLRVSPSQMLIPLSYAAVLGGTCTLIGSSTNITADIFFREAGLPGLTMFELAWVGVPITVIGLIYLATVGRRLLPNRQDLLEQIEANPREFTLELVVRPFCPLVGQSVRGSGLRELPGLYLYALDRGGKYVATVTPTERIMAGDVLCFSGIVSTLVDLQKIRGLDPIEHRSHVTFGGGAVPAEVGAHDDSLDSLEGLPAEVATPAPRTGRQLCEVVIAQKSPLVGQTIKDSNFRARYNASIIAVHRSGSKLQQKIGQIQLHPGDTLLVDADEDFHRRWRNSPDFILVSGVEDSAPVAHERTWLALGLFLVLVGLMTAFDEHVALLAICGAVAMIVTGCVRAAEAHRSVELSVIVLVAAAIGVGEALDKSGAATLIAKNLLAVVAPFGKLAILAAFVFLTGILTELLSNNATVALMAKLALATAAIQGIDPRPLLIAVTVTSSYGFATPIGYQTNLMVLNPGGYKFADYLKVGIPLDILCWTLTVLIVPWLWPL